MSISTELQRIQAAKETISAKLVEFGIALPEDKLDALATKLAGVTNRGDIAIKVTPNNQFVDIEAGYYNGEGKAWVDVEAVYVTPTKEKQEINMKDEKFISYVEVEPIPDEYQDVSFVDATADDVLDGKFIVLSDGTLAEGNIPIRTEDNLTASGATVTVPAGYYDEEATKTVTTAERAATTLETTANGNKFELVASNPQTTGYVTADATKNTATKTVTLTMSGGTATMSDGTYIVETRAQAATRAETNLYVAADDEGDSTKIYLSANNNQGTGYIYTASNKTAAKTLKLSASGKTVSVTDESGETVYGSADVASVEKVSGSINGMTTTTFTQTVNKFVGSVEVTLTNDIENALKEI